MRYCLRCGEKSYGELYCSLCAKGYPPSYRPSQRELKWEKETQKN